MADLAGRGWGEAVGRVMAALVLLGVVGEGMALLAYLGTSGTKPSLVQTAKIGGLIVYTFHHVGINGSFGSGVPGLAIGGSFTLSFAPLAGTLLALWLLYHAGRAVARQGGGGELARGLSGAGVAVPYALILFAFSWLLSISAGGPLAGKASIHPSHLGALLWPLGLGLAAGFWGGVRPDAGTAVSSSPEPAWLWRARAAVGGGLWMLGIALALTFAGLVLLAPLKPHATAVYFRPFDAGVAQGLAVVYATLLFVPNMAAFVLFPSMGSCLAVSGSTAGASVSYCFLSYGHFPTLRAVEGAGGGVPNLPHPPLAYYLFVLAPLIAVLAGGRMAARRSVPGTPQDAIGIGALAGVAFSVLALFTAILAGIWARFGGFLGLLTGSGAGTTRLGPVVASSFVAALAWGVVGGSLGALWEARSRPWVATPDAVASEPVAPEP